MKKFLALLFSAIFISMPIVNANNEIKAQIKQSVVMFISENEVYIDGELSPLDENPKVVPFIENGRTLVPIRFIIEQFSGAVSWNGDTQEITITIDGKKFLFRINNKIVKLDGKEIEIEAAPVLHLEKTYVPLRVIADNVGKDIFYNDGAIIISDEKLKINDLAEVLRNEITSALKNKTYFNIPLSETDFRPLSKYLKSHPQTEYLTLKSDKTIISSNLKVDNLNAAIKEQNIEIDRIDDKYFLSTDNKLYWVFDQTKRTSSDLKSEVGFELLKEDVSDFAARGHNIITLSTSGEVEVARSRNFLKDDDDVSEDLDKRESRYLTRRIYPELTNVKNVYMGTENCFVITTDGKLYGWGENSSYELGLGDKKYRPFPSLISEAETLKPKHITSKYGCTLLITEDNELYVWGSNTESRLGKNDAQTHTPLKIDDFSDVIYCEPADEFILAVKNDGTVWVLGKILGLNPDKKDLKFKEHKPVLKSVSSDKFFKSPALSNMLYVTLYNIVNNGYLDPRTKIRRNLHNQYGITKDGKKAFWSENLEETSDGLIKPQEADLYIRYE